MRPRLQTYSEILKVLVVLARHLVRVLVAGGVLLRVDVEALGVAGEAHGGDDGPAAAALQDGVPVDAGEEGVRLHAGGAAADVAQPARPVHRAQLPDDVLGRVADDGLLREHDRLLDDPV